jgi:hypothetical protein
MTSASCDRVQGVKCAGQAGTDHSEFKIMCDITPDMIRAGVVALKERRFGDTVEDIVEDVFIAMLSESSLNLNM